MGADGEMFEDMKRSRNQLLRTRGMAKGFVGGSEYSIIQPTLG